MSSATNDWVPPAKAEDLPLYTSMTSPTGNLPTAGSRQTAELPVNKADIQLYSMATPNGQKVGIILEELGIDYDAHVVNIMNGSQFNSGFVGVNPNSKIPALLDQKASDGKPLTVFESASICLYLADKYGKFTFTDVRNRTEMMNWLFWGMSGQGPNSGVFGHFFNAPPTATADTRNYALARYSMEVQRLYDVLDKALEGKEYLVANTYSVADIVIFPWFRTQYTTSKHAASGRTVRDFLSLDKYKNVVAWFNRINERPAVQRGVTVCSNGQGKPWLNAK